MPQPQQLTIEQAISQAKKATRQGDTATAFQLYNVVLQHQPNHPVAKKGLRKLKKHLSRNQTVQAQTTNPLQENINALVKLYNTGHMAKTEQTCRKLLQSYPHSPVVFNILGVALQRQGKSQEAVQAFDKAIDLKPDYAEAYSNRGNALKGLGQLKEAVESHDKAIKLKPDYAEAYTSRGNALNDLGKLKVAVESHDKAIELKPDYAEAYTNRGVSLYDLGQVKAAVESHDKAIGIKPDYAMAYSNRGTALYDLGQLQAAVESYDKAIELKPDYAEAYNNRGTVLNDLGKLKAAVESHEKAIGLRPDYAEAYRNLCVLKKYTPGDTQIELMERLYTNSEPGERDRMDLCFALARVCEDLGEYERSFNYLVEGNCLRRKELSYDIDNDRRMFARIKDIFTAGNRDLVAEPDGNASIQPLFIVGMPRSGTSLVEQILASHSKVHGAGELETMNRLVIPTLEMKTGQDKEKSPLEEINTIHDGYLEELAALNVPEKIITDKMPLNFRLIGFILSAFPGSKIINLNRDSRATCWSIYKHYFSGKGNRYAYDMGDLVDYYNLYTDLMSFWRERYPNSIYDLCYEDLTENQEQETCRLLEFCGLEWEEQCLDFHMTKRAVKTASAAQVRKMMYKDSSEAWKKFEVHLQPLINGLGY